MHLTPAVETDGHRKAMPLEEFRIGTIEKSAVGGDGKRHDEAARRRQRGRPFGGGTQHRAVAERLSAKKRQIQAFTRRRLPAQQIDGIHGGAMGHQRRTGAECPAIRIAVAAREIARLGNGQRERADDPLRCRRAGRRRPRHAQFIEQVRDRRRVITARRLVELLVGQVIDVEELAAIDHEQVMASIGVKQMNAAHSVSLPPMTNFSTRSQAFSRSRSVSSRLSSSSSKTYSGSPLRFFWIQLCPRLPTSMSRTTLT